MAKKLAFDKVMFTTVIALLLSGLTMVFSASAATARDQPGLNPFLVKQAIAGGIGLIAMWIAMHVEHRRLASPSVVYALVGGVVLLLLVALFQPEINGTRRWILVGGFSFQPSELAKLAAVVYAAYQIERQQERDSSWELVIPVLALAGLLCVLILLEPDMGTAGLVGMVAVAMIFLAGAPWRLFIAGAALIVPLGFLLVRLEPYRWERVTAFIDPEKYALGAGFQANQSLIAVGSGGLLGLGLGNSVQKLHFLPHPHSDFIFSIVAEELGLLGATVVLGLFGVLLWRGIRTGSRIQDPFGRHLAWGLSGLLVLQALLHVSVALSLIPTTGVPLPFMSAGGTSLIVSLLACGMLLNLSQHA